jgi:hypothetical protein
VKDDADDNNNNNILARAAALQPHSADASVVATSYDAEKDVDELHSRHTTHVS